MQLRQRNTVLKQRKTVRKRTGGAAAEDGAPPPAVVLHCQLEVRQHHCDGGRDDEQDAKHNEQNRVDGVVHVAPQGGEDVVQFDVDGAERQEAGDEHLGDGAAVPGQRRDLSGVLGRSAGRVERGLQRSPRGVTRCCRSGRNRGCAEWARAKRKGALSPVGTTRGTVAPVQFGKH